MWAIRVVSLALAAGRRSLLACSRRSDPARRQRLIFEAARGLAPVATASRGNGSHFGPDLSEAGARRPDQLESSILDPDAEILPANRIYRVVSKTGTTTIGRLLNEDTFSVQMIDKTARLLSFRRRTQKQYAFGRTKSPMPSFKDKLKPPRNPAVTWWLISALSSRRPVRGGEDEAEPQPEHQHRRHRRRPHRSLTKVAPAHGQRDRALSREQHLHHAANVLLIGELLDHFRRIRHQRTEVIRQLVKQNQA